MKKLYRVISLLLVFLALTTFEINLFNIIPKNNNKIFKIKTIKVINNFVIKESEIKKELYGIYNRNIFLINREEVKKPLNNIDFLEKIEVTKKYPNTIVIKIFETKPLAKIVKNKKRYVIDSSSKLILLENVNSYNELPNIFGVEAEKNFLSFFKKLKENNFSVTTINNYYYYKIGRWDVQLFNNKIIKYPDKNLKKAIINSTELIKRKDFKNYNIIDLRIDGKIIVE